MGKLYVWFCESGEEEKKYFVTDSSDLTTGSTGRYARLDGDVYKYDLDSSPRSIEAVGDGPAPKREISGIRVMFSSLTTEEREFHYVGIEYLYYTFSGTFEKSDSYYHIWKNNSEMYIGTTYRTTPKYNFSYVFPALFTKVDGADVPWEPGMKLTNLDNYLSGNPMTISEYIYSDLPDTEKPVNYNKSGIHLTWDGVSYYTFPENGNLPETKYPLYVIDYNRTCKNIETADIFVNGKFFGKVEDGVNQYTLFRTRNYYDCLVFHDDGGTIVLQYQRLLIKS